MFSMFEKWFCIHPHAEALLICKGRQAHPWSGGGVESRRELGKVTKSPETEES